jgi:hypothetical protein
MSTLMATTVPKTYTVAGQVLQVLQVLHGDASHMTRLGKALRLVMDLLMEYLRPLEYFYAPLKVLTNSISMGNRYILFASVICMKIRNMIQTVYFLIHIGFIQFC